MRAGESSVGTPRVTSHPPPHRPSNDDLPDCLSCGSMETKEHHFVQCWCRGKRLWESETFCTVCHAWSWRSYADPEFMMPETFEKLQWETRAEDEEARKVKALASQPGARSVAAA